MLRRWLAVPELASLSRTKWRLVAISKSGSTSASYVALRVLKVGAPRFERRWPELRRYEVDQGTFITKLQERGLWVYETRIHGEPNLYVGDRTQLAAYIGNPWKGRTRRRRSP